MRRMLACLVVSLLFVSGCGSGESLPRESGSAATLQSKSVINRVVEASCGECQFGMEGTGCDLAVRIDGQTYFVDGSSIDEHGDAHGDEGLCNCIRQATVSGEIRGGRFVATRLELVPAQPARAESGEE